MGARPGPLPNCHWHSAKTESDRKTLARRHFAEEIYHSTHRTTGLGQAPLPPERSVNIITDFHAFRTSFCEFRRIVSGMEMIVAALIELFCSD